MKAGLLVALVLCLTTASAYAVGDIAIGAFGGMVFPVVNDDAESGTLFGIQAKVALTSFLGLGAHYRMNSYGDPEQTFFEGTPDEFTSSKDGGNVNSFAVDVYLGKTTGMPGLDLYLMGSVGTFKWSREYTGDLSEITFAGGLGLEIILGPLGIEGRGLFEVIPKGDSSSWKNAIWTVGLNYHFNSLMQ